MNDTTIDGPVKIWEGLYGGRTVRVIRLVPVTNWGGIDNPGVTSFVFESQGKDYLGGLKWEHWPASAQEARDLLAMTLLEVLTTASEPSYAEELSPLSEDLAPLSVDFQPRDTQSRPNFGLPLYDGA